ncbi:unnamed protein product, partial [Rotaria sp. Silwood1]
MAAKGTSDNTPGKRRKLALIIGIGDYKHVNELKNPANDAKQLSSLLKRIGFNTDQLQWDNPQLDKTCKQMKHVLIEFEDSIKPNDIVLFYFAGHGVQWEDQNYLLPADVPDINTINSEKEKADTLKTHAINAQDVLNTLSDRKPYVTIFLLDCCRQYFLRNAQSNTRALNKSDPKSIGLTEMHKAGALIAFACAPGTLIDDRSAENNSLFMEHLLKHIATPNEDIINVLRDVTDGVMRDSGERQIPFMSVQLRHKNIYLCEQSTVPLRASSTDIPRNAKWKQNGITMAGGNGAGDKINQLYFPWGLYVDDDQTIYVSNASNNRIMKWKFGATNGKVIAGGNGEGNRAHQLNSPSDVIIDKKTDNLIISDTENKRVVLWPRQNGTSGKTIVSNISCIGLTMDNDGFLYVAHRDEHEVARYEIDDPDGQVVAGGNGEGNRLDQLSGPTYIFFDRDHSLYVSDYHNHRVMKWVKGAKQGVVVAGGQGQGKSLTQLSYPEGIVVDQSGTVYVADSWNHRIMRWLKGATKGSVIVGVNGPGAQSDQLNCPMGLSFDRHGTTPRTGMPLTTKTTRLPLAIKPSNSTMSSSSSSTNQTLSPTTANAATNSPLSSISQSPSSLPLSKDTKLSSIMTTRHKTSTMKKTKSISKAEIIKSELDEENIDNESGTEAQYDLATSIEESGGVDQFLETPCMILYKRNLTNQVDLENYILKHLSSYNTNKCLFAGVKGTDELKQKINEFYRQHRKKSMESTILFKGNSSRTTITQQILLKKGKLYLYVDGVMKNKTSRNKRKRVSVDLGSVRDVEKVHGNKCSGDDRKSETDFSTKNLKYVKSRSNNDNEEEKSDVEHTDDDASGTVNDATASDLEEGNEKEEEQNMIEVEIAAEETSQTNVLVGGTKRKHINWRGGSKNCGLYLLLHKNEEVKECVNNVLSYGREHGVLLTGVQLKVLLDIQNVEITKDRANAIVQLIASNVEVVSNPHFVAPTAQKSLFEYYGENFELGAVFPAKSIPIPRAIMIKCREDEKKRKKAGGGNKRKKEEKQPMEMMKEKHSTTYNSEDNEVMEIDDEKLNENKINSLDNKQDNKKENKKLNKNHSE